MMGEKKKKPCLVIVGDLNICFPLCVGRKIKLSCHYTYLCNVRVGVDLLSLSFCSEHYLLYQ